MISKLYYIVMKNMLVLFRSKGFVVGVVLAPLVITAIMGSVFSSDDISSINIGIVDDSFDKVSKDLLLDIDESKCKLKSFNAIDECIDSILRSDTHACILFDETFSMGAEKKNTIYVYADHSRVNLVWGVIDAATESLGNSSYEESISLIDKLFEQIDGYEEKIDRNSDKISLIVGDVGSLESRLSNSSEKLDDLDIEDNSTVSDAIHSLSDDIDSFRDKIHSLSAEQDLNSEIAKNFSVLISENKNKLAEFESKFKSTRDDMARERSDCIELRSYTLQKYAQYHCGIYDLSNVSYESDTVQSIYLQCKAVKDDLSVNLQAISDPLQCCYIIDVTSEMADEKVMYLDEQIIELDSMIETTVEMQAELEESTKNLDSLRASMAAATGELDDIDASLDLTKKNLVDIESDANALALSERNKIRKLRDEMSSDLESIVYSINVNRNDLSSIIDSLSEFEGFDEYGNLSAEAIITPLDIVVKPVTKDKSSFDYISPFLLAIMMAFSAVLIAALISIREKLSNTMNRNLICPTSDWLFIFGTYLTNLIVLFVQMTIFMLVLFYFGVYTALNITSLAVALFVVGSAFILCGMFIASCFGTEQSTFFAALSFLIVIVFFSELIIPLEKISSGLQFVSLYNPLNLAITVFRKLVLFGFDIFSVSAPIIQLAVFSGLCFVGVYVLNVVNRKR